MKVLVRTPGTVAWFVLVAATALSWALGSDHGMAHRAASIMILLVAVFKIRLVGRYFMELRHAPVQLRAMFDGYCLLLAGVTIGLYLAA